MKKKFKKLSLSTETLRNLGDPALKGVAGAEEITHTRACSDCTAVCTICTANCTGCCL